MHHAAKLRDKEELKILYFQFNNTLVLSTIRNRLTQHEIISAPPLEKWGDVKVDPPNLISSSKSFSTLLQSKVQ